MESEFILRGEHNEFKESIEKENKRINHRLADLESAIKEIGELTLSVQRLAISMEDMVKAQNRQESRLAELEAEPAKRWKDSTKALFNAFLGAIGSAVAGGVFWLIMQTVK